MDARVSFIRAYLDGFDTLAALCRRYEISRPTGYLWLQRYEAEGVLGLRDRSRRPHHSPTAVAPAVVEALLAARRRHPTWGPKKLLACGWPLAVRPAASTASAILKRAGMVRARRRHRRPGHPGPPGSPPAEPNAVWTIDFKGQFRVGTRWCYPLTVIDRATRFVLACDALPSTETAGTRRVLHRVFQTYGLPQRIRSDNGVPFALPAVVGRLSALAVWWIRLGITPELIEPGCPAQNGRHERFHRTLKADTARPPATSWQAQQARFAAYRETFNRDRPHEALGQRPPADFYVPSPRRYPMRLPPVRYPSAWRVLPVGASGSITWHGRRVFISHLLARHVLACAPLADDQWAVYFGPTLLGHLDDRRGPARQLAAAKQGRSHARVLAADV